MGLIRIILAQLEGSGRGSLASYNQEAYNDLVSFLQSEPLKDGDEWIQKLMLKNSMLGLRVLEVRLAYSLEDFEYDQLERLAKKDMQEANIMLMRSFATTNFENAVRSAESNIISSVTQSPEDKEEQQQQQQQGQ
ncbi:hypothetical protein CEUSTIGMA_g4553.t1 [Chlamydomonas eustigma]|uniref:Uncharacterized protein n=1 Tax=Chlamydomonas eustigma TaxID=1157962 RepID=A0A250X202_9CHLO|nr:hypothetical protein CEUSTIGMA_g4553.t1 [Chlamydomonas eustigma]|eukprot:GAX77107.1 hypothetical protein CEUSTIGMA_g4553.t1 [Chlamydomonas eustigma]